MATRSARSAFRADIESQASGRDFPFSAENSKIARRLLFGPLLHRRHFVRSRARDQARGIAAIEVIGDACS
jgi:hypothetical protein